MIKTPIADFLEEYARCGASRFHMPGHKGREPYDLTEIDGAGDLFARCGIIAESEKISSALFGCPTYYSAEGSSLAIRTMLALASRSGKKVVAARNAHSAFLSGAITLDLDVVWAGSGESYVSCGVTPRDVEDALEKCRDAAFVYVTSPDYLGNVCDVKAISKVCKKHGALLLVDCAHGAYLKFLNPSLYPIDLGADMCAASAHKTLPVLTGGAYLHLSERANALFGDDVKETMRLFASSSPSYLIMRSLDLANRRLEGFDGELEEFTPKVERLKSALICAGYEVVGDEPIKITIKSKSYGYEGDELAKLFIESGVIPEFHDRDYLTLMLSPDNTDEDLLRLERAALAVKKRPAIDEAPPRLALPRCAMKPREAYFSVKEPVSPKDSVGRIMASISVFCPPAVPIAVCGEVIDEATANAFKYYGINEIQVVK